MGELNANLRRSLVAGLVVLTAGGSAAPVYARNTQYMLKIADALKDPLFAAQVPIDVDFYFASQPLPKTGTPLGEVEVRLKRRMQDTKDEQNCHMAFVAVLNELREKAIAAGGNSVSNLVSYYKQ